MKAMVEVTTTTSSTIFMMSHASVDALRTIPGGFARRAKWNKRNTQGEEICTVASRRIATGFALVVERQANLAGLRSTPKI